MNIPYERKVYEKSTGTGAKVYKEETIPGLCYPVGEVEQITDYRGTTVISNSKIYIDGNTELNVQDAIVIEGAEGNIKLINLFYRNGKVDIKVVFL